MKNHTFIIFTICWISLFVYQQALLSQGVAQTDTAELDVAQTDAAELDVAQGDAQNDAQNDGSATAEEQEQLAWGVETSHRREHIYPSNWGHAGIFRLRSAESLPEDTLTFGVGGEFYTITDSPVVSGSSTAKTIAENLFVGYSPVDRWTLALQRRNSSTTFGIPQRLISSLGDLNFSVMYSIPLNDSMAVAPVGNFLIASNFNDLAPAGNTVSAGIGGAFSLSFYPALALPLFLHANLIYHMPQIRGGGLSTVEPETFFQFSRFHTITYGISGEYKLGDFIPFIELNQTVHAGSGVGFGRTPSRASIGTRITPISNKSLALLLGVDIGLGRGLASGVPFMPGYQILGQVSYTVALSSTERKHYYTTADVNVVDRKFVIRKNINFKVNSAELASESTALLDQIATVIQQNKIRKLLIIGHTDSTHTEAYNLGLSVKRGQTVKKYLVGKGIGEDRLLTQGYGKRRPKASNLTSAGRARNRRVEFYILE